jgi:hypothetical protein
LGEPDDRVRQTLEVGGPEIPFDEEGGRRLR